MYTAKFSFGNSYTILYMLCHIPQFMWIDLAQTN